jgi:FAD-linked sulfhydryl oxidase
MYVVYVRAVLYPCSSCAKHFQLRIDQNPPDVTSRDGLTRWLCHSHNAVNLRNNKPLYGSLPFLTSLPLHLC